MAAINYQDWYIPLAEGGLSLGQARHSMEQVRAEPADIPLMVQLVENPKFQFPGLTVFHGAVDLAQHDFIHIVLGRGLLEKDEAFTIGFTMGSTKKVTTTEETLYGFIAQYLYPKVYQLNSEDLRVFKDAVRLAYISDCQALDVFDFSAFSECSLKEVRQALGLETELLMAYYQLEHKRYPRDKASQRLLDQRSAMWPLLDVAGF